MSLRTLEWIIRAKVQAGLETIRNNPALVDEIFEDLSVASRTQLKRYLQNTEVQFLLAYPRGTPDIPLWCLTMVGETPVYRPIGQIIDRSVADDSDEQGLFVRKAYQIYTVSGSPDVTLALSNILQHILKSLVADLSNDGFYEIQTAQADVLDQKMDWLPTHGFVRVTLISVLVEDTFVYVDTQAAKVEVGNAGPINSDGSIDVVFT
jgi:hypothetical protein